jgi:hypothetical protein
LALAAACALKAIHVSLKHDPDSAELREADDAIEAIIHYALVGADEDSQLFAQLLTAHGAKEASEAAAEVAEVAESLVHSCETLSRCITRVEPHVRPAVQGDLRAAKFLAHAAAAVHRANADESRRDQG